MRVLRTVGWTPAVRASFFAAGAGRLPEVEYRVPDLAPVHEALAAARRHLDRPLDEPPNTEGEDDGDDRGDAEVDAWLRRVADKLEGSAAMLAAVGTTDFHRWSCHLYGAPADPLPDGGGTSLELARRLDDVLSDLTPHALGVAEPVTLDADELAARMRDEVRRHLGERAPAVEVVDHLSANAIAEQGVIRVRRGARFSDRDVVQLVQHEALVHAATSLNGQAQEELPILAGGHAGTTRTQEGLAVFAELVTGAMDPWRFRRLADRVLAIQMAIDGASFLDVYRAYLARDLEPEQAFESTRRVFRGGVLEGGAPFTKDVVYLDGLLRVHTMLRFMVLAERADAIPLLFCGKLDLDDLPALGRLWSMGLVRPPTYLPPWAADLRFVVSYLAYSSFLGRLDVAGDRASVGELLARTPRVERRTA